MRVTAQQGVPDAVPWPDTSIILYPVHRLMRVIAQQGVPGDAVPWPEREVSSLPFPSPAAAGGTGKVPE